MVGAFVVFLSFVRPNEVLLSVVNPGLCFSGRAVWSDIFSGRAVLVWNLLRPDRDVLVLNFLRSGCFGLKFSQARPFGLKFSQAGRLCLKLSQAGPF